MFVDCCCIRTCFLQLSCSLNSLTKAAGKSSMCVPSPDLQPGVISQPRHAGQARLDFEDEVEELAQTELQQRMHQLMEAIDAALATRSRGALLHKGLQVLSVWN